MSDENARGRSGRTGWIIGLSVTVIATLVALGLVLTGVVTIPGTSAPETAGEAYVFVAADDVGDDPFSEIPLATPPNPNLLPPTTPTTTADEAAALLTNVTTVSGTTPGLYGGSMDNSKCDAGQLVAFLASNPDKAAAWVAALNADPELRWGDNEKLTVAEIPAYVANLIPVTLWTDTLVTNHGFIDGVANPIQSVLQAGTAVLTDRFGVPRVRCYCGNPLVPPKPIPPNPPPPGDPKQPPPPTVPEPPPWDPPGEINVSPPCIELPDSVSDCEPVEALEACSGESFESCEPMVAVAAPICSDLAGSSTPCPAPGPSGSAELPPPQGAEPPGEAGPPGAPEPPAQPEAPAQPEQPVEFQPVPPSQSQCSATVPEGTPWSTHALVNNSSQIIDVWVWGENCAISSNFRIFPGASGFVEGTPGWAFSITSNSPDTLMVIQIDPGAGDYVFG